MKPISSHCPLSRVEWRWFRNRLCSPRISNLSAILSQRYPDMLVFDTICGATKERQSDLVSQLNRGRGDCGDRRKALGQHQETGQLAAANGVRLFTWKRPRISMPNLFFLCSRRCDGGASTPNSSFARFASGSNPFEHSIT